MELLNIDELAVANRAIKVGGKSYPIVEQTVASMLNHLSLAKKGKKKADFEDPEFIINSTLDAVKSLIPDCPHEVLRNLSFKSLTAILEFANASDKEVVEGSKDETSGEEGTDAEKK